MHVNKLLFALAWFTILSWAVLLLLCIFWLVWPYHVIDFTYNELPILNENHIVHRGQPVLWKSDHIHYTNGVKVIITKNLVCSTLTQFPDTSYLTKAGSFTAVNSSVTIPSNNVLGKCFVNILSVFAINPLRSITFEKHTEGFTVVP